VGAEALEALGFSDPAMGIVVKIHDGNTRALGPVVLAVLKELGFITNIEEYPYLRAHDKPIVLNNRNLVTGHIVAEENLLKRSR
jgi:L-asparaginase II